MRLANSFLKDLGSSEDVVQTVFIKLWKQREVLSKVENLNAYLKRMVINAALSHLRKQQRHPTLHVEEMPEKAEFPSYGESPGAHDSKVESIQEAINELPPKCQTIFKLSRFEQLTYKEIAGHLKISEKTVENQIGIALRMLRSQLK